MSYRTPVLRIECYGKKPPIEREGFLAAISSNDLMNSKLENDRICSRHFISEEPAPLFDELNPNWLPTQNLGHCTERKRSAATCSEDRYMWKKARLARARMEATCCQENSATDEQTPACNVVEMEGKSRSRGSN